VADYFLSDVHIRLDRPDRDTRLVRFLDRVEVSDRLFIVGDLCDFWFATRQRAQSHAVTPGMAALRAFTERGGSLVLMLGNHDAWLRDFYERRAGLALTGEPLEVESYGLRIRLEHGHRNKAKRLWKAMLEGRTFFHAFSAVPDPLARLAQRVLERVNARTRDVADRRMIAAYETQAAALRPAPDIAVFGHVHRVHDARHGPTRVVVLGDWFENSCFLKVDERGAEHVCLADTAAQPVTASPSGR
jgi:UDP-2,3-diacylglucosamine hydrolase